MSKKLDLVKEAGGIWSFVFRKAFKNGWCMDWAHALAVDEENKIVHFIQNNGKEVEISFAECWSEREFWDSTGLPEEVVLEFFKRLIYGELLTASDIEMGQKGGLPLGQISKEARKLANDFETRWVRATSLVLNKIEI